MHLPVDIRPLFGRPEPSQHLVELRDMFGHPIVTTDIVSGETVVLSEGPTDLAVAATTAIPGAFAPVKQMGLHFSDGAVSSNTPVSHRDHEGCNQVDHPSDDYANAGSGTAHGGGRKRDPRADFAYCAPIDQGDRIDPRRCRVQRGAADVSAPRAYRDSCSWLDGGASLWRHSGYDATAQAYPLL